MMGLAPQPHVSFIVGLVIATFVTFVWTGWQPDLCGISVMVIAIVLSILAEIVSTLDRGARSD